MLQSISVLVFFCLVGAVNAYESELKVDYNQPRAKMISALQLDWVDPSIRSDGIFARAYVRGHRVFVFRLFHFKEATPKTSIAKSMSEDGGYRPANLEELLAFGQRFTPTGDRKHTVIAYGTEALLYTSPKEYAWMAPALVYAQNPKTRKWVQSLLPARVFRAFEKHEYLLGVREVKDP